jgi:hypothetical protein
VAIDSSTIDRIVANVLQQLGTGGDAAPVKTWSTSADTAASQRSGSVRIDERVITAKLLAERVNGAAAINIGSKAILTPSARDFISERGLRIDRGTKETAQAAPTSSPGPAAGTSVHQPSTVNANHLLIVVRNTDAVSRLWTDLHTTWTRELLGCPDDAAGLAIRELARGAVQTVVILAEQTHRAACLANRSPAVKAVAVRDAGDVAQVLRQLRANTWCIDPTSRNWFELRNLFNAILKPA